jgi:hypothetical protein
MNLSQEDAGLFFKLMWELQFYVNNRLNLIPQIKSTEAYIKLSQEDKFKVREALYQHINLIDDFVRENPAKLPPEELDLVRSWKQFVVGDFYILKFLKRYTIFLPAKDETNYVYAVLGLYEAIEDIFSGHPLPILVKTILLPFKGKIIYDGLFQSHLGLFFGPGIRGSLNESYQRAKQNGRIIESLAADAINQPAAPPKVLKDWTPTLDEIVKTTEKLRQTDNVIQSKAFGLLKASAKLAQATAHDPNNLEELFKQARSAEKALNQMWQALERAE